MESLPHIEVDITPGAEILFLRQNRADATGDSETNEIAVHRSQITWLAAQLRRARRGAAPSASEGRKGKSSC
jgi:hypothetical protein